MTFASRFPIAKRWPPKHPDAIHLCSLDTPNGIRVSPLLEGTGLPHDAHCVSFQKTERMSPEFLSLNPGNKIPAIIDPHGPGGTPLPLWESGAILLSLADRTGRFIPSDPAGRWQAIRWLMFRMGGIGPMFGQVGWVHRWAGNEIADPRPRQRYCDEARRLLGVPDGQPADKDWQLGDCSILDMAICPWLRSLRDTYGAGAEAGLNDQPRILAWLARFLARPAVRCGLNVPAPPNA